MAFPIIADEGFQRPNIACVSKCSRFTFDDKEEERPDFEHQFNDIYRVRLDTLRPRIIEAAGRKWGSKVPVKKLTELRDSKEKCVIVGTIYKLQALKPSVLKEISDEASVTPQPIRVTKYTSADDKCILEDENLRVNLIGPNIDHGTLVTGVTLGVYGWQDEGGSFQVIGLCFAEAPPPPRPIPTAANDGDRFVLLISGLNFHFDKMGDEDDARRILYCRLLADWITGKLGDEEELANVVSRVTRVIIAGGNVSKKCHCDGREYGQIARYRARKTAPPSVEAVRQLDDFLHRILPSVDVDLMPGEHDPTNHMLPQQPLHKCLLPKSGRMASLHQCTNPYSAEIDGVSFLGTSGQNIADILKYSTIVDGITALESTMTWCHLCPTAPDTTACFPYYDADPFVLDSPPNVYFVGNQAKLQSKLIGKESTKTLLLSLPKFNETGTGALVNTRTLTVRPIVFSGGGGFMDDESTTTMISQNGRGLRNDNNNK